jgi:hypothetical protein
MKDVYAGRHASSIVVTDSTGQLNNTSRSVESEALVDKFNVAAFLNTTTTKMVVILN